IVGLLFEIVNRVADDATFDARPFMSFEKIFNRQWCYTPPASLFRKFRGINMGMPIDDHKLTPLTCSSRSSRSNRSTRSEVATVQTAPAIGRGSRLGYSPSFNS